MKLKKSYSLKAVLAVSLVICAVSVQGQGWTVQELPLPHHVLVERASFLSLPEGDIAVVGPIDSTLETAEVTRYHYGVEIFERAGNRWLETEQAQRDLLAAGDLPLANWPYSMNGLSEPQMIAWGPSRFALFDGLYLWPYDYGKHRWLFEQIPFPWSADAEGVTDTGGESLSVLLPDGNAVLYQHNYYDDEAGIPALVVDIHGKEVRPLAENFSDGRESMFSCGVDCLLVFRHADRGYRIIHHDLHSMRMETLQDSDAPISRGAIGLDNVVTLDDDGRVVIIEQTRFAQAQVEGSSNRYRLRICDVPRKDCSHLVDLPVALNAPYQLAAKAVPGQARLLLYELVYGGAPATSVYDLDTDTWSQVRALDTPGPRWRVSDLYPLHDGSVLAVFGRHYEGEEAPERSNSSRFTRLWLMNVGMEGR